MAKELGKIDL